MLIERPQIVNDVVDNDTGLKDPAISSFGILRHTKSNICTCISIKMLKVE